METRVEHDDGEGQDVAGVCFNRISTETFLQLNILQPLKVIGFPTDMLLGKVSTLIQ